MERYVRYLRHREDILEESGGDNNGDGEGGNDGEINIVVRQ